MWGAHTPECTLPSVGSARLERKRPDHCDPAAVVCEIRSAIAVWGGGGLTGRSITGERCRSVNPAETRISRLANLLFRATLGWEGACDHPTISAGVSRSMVSGSDWLIDVEGNNAVLVQRPAVVNRAAFLVDTVSAEPRIDAQQVVIPLTLAHVRFRCFAAFAKAIPHTLRRGFYRQT